MARLYDLSVWRGEHGLRLARLRDEPFCRACLAKGIHTKPTEVDHIQRHEDDLELFLDYENTQSLCHACHVAKTHEETRVATARPAIGLDGWPEG